MSLHDRRVRIYDIATRMGLSIRQRPSGVWELRGKGIYLLTRDLGLVTPQDLRQTMFYENLD